MTTLGEVITKDVTGSRPAASIEGQLFSDETTGSFQRDTGADWETIASNKRYITYEVDGGGSAITAGNTRYVRVPYGCTITKWTLLAAPAGAIVIDIWNDTFANYPPTVADTITASAKPTLVATDDEAEDSTLTGWDTTIAAGTVLGFIVDSAATCTWAILQLEVTQTS